MSTGLALDKEGSRVSPCQSICRVLQEALVKGSLFAECMLDYLLAKGAPMVPLPVSLPSQRLLCQVSVCTECLALSKGGLCRVSLFVECPINCTRTISWHSTNSLFLTCKLLGTECGLARRLLAHSVNPVRWILKPLPFVFGRFSM